MALQAEIYQEAYHLSLTEFIESARKRITDPALLNLIS